MKKRLRYILAMGLVTCMGCSDWLDVNPRTEMKQEELFQAEDGYKEALIGAYIQLASTDLYGKNMSMYFTEFLAHTWEVPYSGTESYIAAWKFDHADVEPMIEKIWKAYYRCIVHLNDILKHIDGSEALFSNNNYNLIKGEALGLRGFLHLELLRLFGPIPDAAAGGKVALPYAEEMTKDPGKLRTLTYDEVCRKIIRDLDAAEELLKDEPLNKADNWDLNNPTVSDFEDKERPKDDWQLYRQVRFNYYAVKGAKARYYHWIGDRENALKYAKEVIESKKFRLTNENDYDGNTWMYGRDYLSNLVMVSEQLFGVDVPSLQSIVQPLFKIESPLLQQEADYIRTAYENSSNDIRNKNYWKPFFVWGAEYGRFLKYTGSDVVPAYNHVPVLRLAEMYLIVIENSPIGAADSYWIDFIIARNLPDPLRGILTSADAVKAQMEKEWRKEFMGEGQMFFFYKKHAYKEYSWPGKFTVPTKAEYEIPRPQSQTVFD